MSDEQKDVLKGLLERMAKIIKNGLLELEEKTIMSLEYGAARVERVDCGANPRVP